MPPTYPATWQGVLLLIAVILIVVRIMAFHTVPWLYFAIPALLWVASVIVRALVDSGMIS